MKSLLFTFFLLWSLITAHAQLIVLSNSDKGYPIFEYSAVLEEQSGNVTIDSLLKQPNKYRFVAINGQTRVTDPQKEHWYRFTVQSSLQIPLYLYAEYAQSELPFLATIYQVYNNQLQDKYTFAKGQDDLSTTIPQSRRRRLLPLSLQPTKSYTFYWHSAQLPRTIKLVPSDRLLTVFYQQDLFVGFYYGFVLIIILYNLILYARLKDRDHLIYAIWVSLLSLGFSIQFAHFRGWLPYYEFFFKHNVTIAFLTVGAHILFGISFLQLRQHARVLYRIGIGLVSLCLIAVFAEGIGAFLGQHIPYNYALVPGAISLIFTPIAGAWAIKKGFKPAWYYLLGTLFIHAGALTFILQSYGWLPASFWTQNSNQLASMAEIMLFTLALAYKVNLLKQQREDAIQNQLILYQENQQLIETQNRVLEEKVEQRTAELKASQAQLIQKEKLASLGELTAGIAHEIQNPLNFVNNFSEVSTELVDELKEELSRGELQEVGFIADDLRQNLTKIAHHGRRASAIVKGMLEHSNGDSGEKQETDLVRLTEECFKIAYQGYRSKHQDFSCELLTHFQPDILPLQLVAQDMGRVVINLYNNAFYAIYQRSHQRKVDYTPQIELCIEAHSGYAELRIKDNGTGIPDSIKPKIFQPFFTTKPAGDGTGLGLSLSYDIVTKGHGGTMMVESVEGEGTQFIITLPV